MPSITYNGQSFAIDNRRFWVLGASMHYARIPVDQWPERIAAAKQAGFNTIETACPWLIHEPRRGRYDFQGQADVRGFIKQCAAAGMRVILRVGPFVGSQFDGGGIPGWLAEAPEIALRESNEIFLEHVSRYFRRLLSEVTDLQATSDGPILLVQAEHAWTCSNDVQAEKYLHEIARFIREAGITVPLINANDLWQEVPGTLDTWRGFDDLLVHLRQLRTVQPNAPRLVSAFEAAGFDTWGSDGPGNAPLKGARGSKLGGRGMSAAEILRQRTKTPQEVLRRLAEVLAAGAQPIVSPFHGGTNFGFLAGRAAGCQSGFVTTRAASAAPLGEAGGRGPRYNAVKRLITFANHFGQVFADFDPDFHPVVIDPGIQNSISAAAQANPKSKIQSPNSLSVVHQRGPQGQIVFVFGNESDADASAILTLDDGLRLPVHLGDQGVGWYALGIDLQGIGRLDYANVCPWALIDRSVLVIFGPARSQALLSISGTPLEATIPPADSLKPLVMEHRGLTVVICNQQQIDQTYHDETAVYVGIGGFDAHGGPLRSSAAADAQAWVIRKGGLIESLRTSVAKSSGSPALRGRRGETSGSESRTTKPKPSKQAAELKLEDWGAAPAAAFASGESQRFASLDGPQSLSACGASSGYGWYRIMVDASASVRKQLWHVPLANDRIHLYLDGKPQGVLGVGPGASPEPFEPVRGAASSSHKGKHAIVALVDNLGRFAEGNDLAQCKGICGHIYAIKPLRGTKPKVQTAKPIDPFELRGFLSGRGVGQVSDSQQAIWTFAHTRKSPILIDIRGAQVSGTFVLNDQLIAYYAGATGGCLDRIVLDPKTTPGFKRGNNQLRFAPDAWQDTTESAAADAVEHTTLYECVEVVTEPPSATWAFAKWDPPPRSEFIAIRRGGAGAHHAKPVAGIPCWWRASFHLNGDAARHDELPIWFETTGLSKGQVFINGRNLGRYFTATATGKHVGPQTRLYVPTSWLRTDAPNELIIFDEHGFDPHATKVVRAADQEE